MGEVVAYVKPFDAMDAALEDAVSKAHSNLLFDYEREAITSGSVVYRFFDLELGREFGAVVEIKLMKTGDTASTLDIGSVRYPLPKMSNANWQTEMAETRRQLDEFFGLVISRIRYFLQENLTRGERYRRAQQQRDAEQRGIRVKYIFRTTPQIFAAWIEKNTTRREFKERNRWIVLFKAHTSWSGNTVVIEGGEREIDQDHDGKTPAFLNEYIRFELSPLDSDRTEITAFCTDTPIIQNYYKELLAKINQTFFISKSDQDTQTELPSMEEKTVTENKPKSTRKRKSNTPKPQVRMQNAIQELSLNRVNSIRQSNQIPQLKVALDTVRISEKKLKEYAYELWEKWERKDFLKLWKYDEDKEIWEVSEE